MAALATETWTGANGAAWPAQWTVAQSAGSGGSSSIQSNTGYLNAGSAATSGMKAFLSGMTAATDTEILITFSFGAQISSGFNFQICADNTTYSGNPQEMPNNGYTLNFNSDTTTTNGSFDMWKMSGGGYTQIYATTTLSFAFTAGVQYRVRFQRYTTLIRFRIWSASAAEPTTWLASYSDTGTMLAANQVCMAVGNNTATAQSMTYDNLTVSVPTLGSAKVSSIGGYVAKPVKVWSGSAWVVKPLKRWNGSAWVKTNY